MQWSYILRKMLDDTSEFLGPVEITTSFNTSARVGLATTSLFKFSRANLLINAWFPLVRSAFISFRLVKLI